LASHDSFRLRYHFELFERLERLKPCGATDCSNCSNRSSSSNRAVHCTPSIDQCPHSRGALLIRNADHVPGTDHQRPAEQFRQLRRRRDDSLDPWHLPLSSVAAVVNDSVHFWKVKQQCRFHTAVFGHVGNHHCGSDAHAFQQPGGLGEVCVRQSTAPFCQRCA